MRIVIPLFDQFTALDAVGPYQVLSEIPGAEVVFAAAQRGPVRSDTGMLAIVADASLREVDTCEVLVVPGGPGARGAATDETLLGWVRQVHTTTQWTTSVCTGALVLAAAGLLQGLEATTHWAAVDELEAFGARYTARRVVPEGKIVTAAGVSAGIDMALTLAARIAGNQVAEAIQLAIEYDPQPPFDHGSVAKSKPETLALSRSLLTKRAAASRSDRWPGSIDGASGNDMSSLDRYWWRGWPVFMESLLDSFQKMPRLLTWLHQCRRAAPRWKRDRALTSRQRVAPVGGAEVGGSTPTERNIGSR
jgi:putative intracellular protease/amidase